MQDSLLSTLRLPCILFIVALALRAIFAFLETSITALRLFKLNELASQSTGRYVNIFQALERSPHRVLITVLIVSSCADVTAGALSTYIIETIFRHFNFATGVGFTVGIAIAAIMILIFGEIIPKNLARGKSERIFTSMLWFINLIYYLLYPLSTLLTRFSDALLFWIGHGDAIPSGSEWVASEREVQFLINYIHQQGLMETEKTEMLRSIFDLGSTPVREIMIPATDITSLSITTPMRDALRACSESHFTRLPLYKGAKDNIVGMVHQKDLILLFSNESEATVSLEEIMRPILFIPDSMKINQLLREFRQQQMHIAIVLNEHGIVTGLITLEDVLEEIVGEISDEHEAQTEKITPLQDGGWLAEASVPVEELEVLLNISFETESAMTLGGFLTERLQHMPKKGERVPYKNYYFQIQKATKRRVEQVLIFEEHHTKNK